MAKPTQEQIAAWKKEHGDIFEVSVDGRYGYLKKPDRKTIAYASSVQNNPIKSNEIILNNCWIGGDEEIKTDDSLFMSVQSVLGNILEVKQAELVKL